jgi:outer membrane protein TolC
MGAHTANAHQATDTINLTLDECLRIALNENPTIKVADMEIERVDYSKKETIAQLFPDISFAGSYSRTIKKQTMSMNGQSIQIGSENSYTLGFSASLPIIAVQLWKSLKLSDDQILINVEKARESRLSLINQVENAYYGLLYAQDALKVIEENKNRAQLNADIYRKKYENGTASEYDVLRAEVQVKNVEPTILDMKNTINQAKLQLKLLMGMDMAHNIKIVGQLSDYQEDMYKKVLDTNVSLDNNTTLRTLDLQTQTLKNALSVQQAAWYPTLALTANYNWMALTNGGLFKDMKWNPYSTVGLAVSIPIFQGGKRYYKQKQAEISYREMSWQRDNLQNALKLQVQSQFDNIQKSVSQIETNKAGVAQAVKANQIMEKSFRIGAASYLDLRDSENALMSAQLAYYQSIYGWLTAQSQLSYLLGNKNLDQYKSETAN